MALSNNHNKKVSKLKVVLILLYILILALYGTFIISNIKASMNNTYPSYFGSYAMPVNSDSVGEIRKGDIVIGKIQENDVEYSQGTIITYQYEDHYTFGKVVSSSKNGDSIIYKVSGQDSSKTDSVAASKVLGSASSRIPFFGYIYKFLWSTAGMLVIVVLPCLIIFIIQVLKLVKSIKQEAKQKQQKIRDQQFIEKYKQKREHNYAKWDKPEDDYKRVFDQFQTLDQTQSNDSPESEISSSSKNLKKKSPLFDYDSTEPYFNNIQQKDDKDKSELEKSFDELKYKMKFQDTSEIKGFSDPNQQEPETIEASFSNHDMEKLGLKMNVIDDGLEIDIDQNKAKDLKLVLKNDGSLKIVTKNYNAEINTNKT